MAAKTNPTDLIKWTGITLAASAGMAYSGSWFLQTALGMDVPVEIRNGSLAGLTFLAAWKLYYRQWSQVDDLVPLRQRKPAAQLQASSRQIRLVSGDSSRNILLNALPTIFGQNRPNMASDGPQWWQYGDCVVYEDLAFEFWRKGWTRQMKAHPHPFSESWMRRQRFYALGSRRLEKPEFAALAGLTTDYNLWSRVRRQGSSGRLRIHPLGCIARVTGKW